MIVTDATKIWRSFRGSGQGATSPAMNGPILREHVKIDIAGS